jgi:hypothetical protein
LAGERCGAEGSRQRNRREQGVQVQLHAFTTHVRKEKLHAQMQIFGSTARFVLVTNKVKYYLINIDVANRCIKV